MGLVKVTRKTLKNEKFDIELDEGTLVSRSTLAKPRRYYPATAEHTAFPLSLHLSMRVFL